MAQGKGKGKGLKYATKIIIEINGNIPRKDLRDLLQGLGATLTEKMENGP